MTRDRPVTEPTEIEVTPEMIEAGIREYCLFDFEDRAEWVVVAVYRAMVAVALRNDDGSSVGVSGLAGHKR